MISRKVKSRLGAAIGALACLTLFGGAGAFFAWAIGATIHDGLRAGDWVRVKANVERVEVGQATYSYEWQGKRYVGDRAGTFVLGGSSEVDDWDDRMDALLTAAVERKQPITAWVNPENPAESMIDREIRWKLLLVFVPFAIGFGGAGLAAFYLIGRQALGLQQTGGSVPWLKPQARQALFQWAVTLVWNAVSLPIALIAIPSLYASGEWFPIVLLVIFPLFGVLMLWSALASTVAVLRAGNPFNARSAA